MKTNIERLIVSQLTASMWACKRNGFSYADCMAEARAQFNKEVREQADATPLPK